MKCCSGGQGVNQAYYCSAANPVFWGWSKFFNLMGAIAQQAQAAGLTVEKADIDNEINLEQFTVTARLIYDNVREPSMTNVIEGLGQAMSPYGFNSSRATIDVPMPNLPVGQGSFDCGSAYGDSAVLDASSQALAAFGGAKIGQEPYIDPNSPPQWACYNSRSSCGAPPKVNTQSWVDCVTQGMITLPASTPVPSIQDLHAQPCLISSGNCAPANDVTVFAKDVYSDLWSFLTYRG